MAERLVQRLYALPINHRHVWMQERRERKPEKGDDILLSVITDGRHAAIDLRFVLPDNDNDPENKLDTSRNPKF